MKALLAIGTLCLVLATLPGAQAQQSGALTVMLDAPETELREDMPPVVFAGRVMLVVDYTAMLSMTGIPVTYTVTKQPEWATVLISPSTDVFPVPSGPPAGAAYWGERPITVTVGLGHAVDEDMLDLIEITATTTAGPLGRSFQGKGSVPISVIAPEPPCPEHAALTSLQMSQAVEAVDAYNEYQAAKAEEGSEEVSTQSATASPVPLPWVAVAGFALVGAGVGLALRRRLAR